MRTRLPIGLQLYTLGPGLASDLDGQLSQVAAIGYRTVEMAGYLGRTPKELRAAFDKAGLTCISSHVQGRPTGSDPSLADLDRLIADARVIGLRSVVLPMFPVPERISMTPQAGEDRRAVLGRLAAQMTLDDWKATADLLNSKGAALKAAGLRLGYHNTMWSSRRWAGPPAWSSCSPTPIRPSCISRWTPAGWSPRATIRWRC
ncbi:MAG: Xylose isomerase domain protein barrel [Phenylobacterium sp.]|nr:Xylose isomerase domain protein barrel [Phenylobacterium sp.]